MRKQSTFQEDPGEIVSRVRDWIENVTGKELGPDIRESLQNGVVLCELMAKIRPGSIQRVNKLNSPIAHLDNIRSFLQACRVHFMLNEAQVFDVTDLQDPEQRSGAFTSVGAKGWDAEKRLKNVCVTLYWIGRKLAEERSYQGPLPDLSVFHPVLPGQSMSVPIPEDPEDQVLSPGTRSLGSPPVVPSRPDPKLVSQIARREHVSGSSDSDNDVIKDRVEIHIVPINGSFGFHLLSRAVPGTNKFLSTVHSVLEESSAGQAGLQRGDELLTVNGMDTSYFSHQQIVKLIKDSITAQSLTLVIQRKQTTVTNGLSSETTEEIKPQAPPQDRVPLMSAPPPESVPPPKEEGTPNPDPIRQFSKPELNSTADSVQKEGAISNPTHYVFNTEETKYRPVPPVPPVPSVPQEPIYVNQTLLDREVSVSKELPPKQNKASPKERSPRNKKRGQERAHPEGSLDLKEQTLGAKTPRSQMPLPPPPQKEVPQAPNSEPTRRRFFGSKKGGDTSPPKKGGDTSPTKRSSWKSGWKEAIVQSVDLSSPPARLESVRLDPSEDSGEDLLDSNRRELSARDRSNRVSMTDPFKGILPVSDGRSLLDEIFPDGEELQLGSILKDDSPLKTPPQQRQQPSKEYFAKILNPQITQQDTFQPPVTVTQDVKLRERMPEKVKQSSNRSSGSSERHSAKLVGSLLASSGPQVTPVNNDRKKERREIQQQAPVIISNGQKQQQQYQQQQDSVMSTHSLPVSTRPPQVLPPSNSSVCSSPPRHSNYANQQLPSGYQGRSKISRAKSFTGSHQSRESSDERNFSHLMGRGYPGSDYSHGQTNRTVYAQDWSQRSYLQRGQSLRQDPVSHKSPNRPVMQMAPKYGHKDQRIGPYMYQQNQYTQGYSQVQAYPSYQMQYPSIPAVRAQIPPEPQSPRDGQYISKIFRINQSNASIPCTSCKIPLGAGPATGVHGLPNIYHPPCFLCEVCGGQLFESTFIISGKLHCKCCEDSKDGNLSTVC